MKKLFNLYVLFIGLFLCCIPSSMYADLYGRSWVGKAKLHHGKLKDRDIKFETGYAMGVAVGYSFLCYFRGEIEGIQLFDKFKDVKRKIEKSGFKGRLRDYTFVTNFIIEGPTVCYLKPYIGVGGGFSYERLKIHTIDSFKQKEKNHEKRFGRQFLGGISASLFDVSLFLEGRYFVLDKQVKGLMLDAGLSIRF